MLHVIKKEQMSWKLGSVNGVYIVVYIDSLFLFIAQ